MRWVAVLIALAAAFVGGRIYLLRRLEMDLIKVHRLGQRTPAARGLLFEELPIDSGGPAPPPFHVPADRPLLPIFHRNRPANTRWVGVLEMRHRARLAPPVFSYTDLVTPQGQTLRI